MYPGEVFRIENTEYILGAYLSSGLIGTVFPAWEKTRCQIGEIPSNQKNGEPDYAVKVLAPNADQILRTRFLSENDILSSANEIWHQLFAAEPSPFPVVKKANWQGQELLAMEFVPQSWNIGKQIGEGKNALERERFCLLQAVRYAQMLQALHQAGKVCLDRKPIDIYFDISHERLIVLDWNVVETYAEDKVADEHAIFAAMWYGFLTGKVPPLDFNPLNDGLWGEVSLETRNLLNNLWLGRYKNDVDVINKFIKANENLNKSPSLLFAQAPTKERINECEKQNESSGELYWEGLVLRDLAYRLADKDEQQASKDQFEDFQSFFNERFGRFFFEAQMSLRKEKYEEGLVYLQKIRESVQGDDNLELQHERWRILLEAGKVANEQKISFFDVSQLFQNWLKEIQDRNPKNGHTWRQMFEEIVKIEKFQEIVEIHRSLLVFEKEIQIREKWDDFEQKFQDLKDGRISDHHYRNIQDIFNDISNLLEGLPVTYAKSLRHVLFPDFDIWKRRVADRVSVEDKFYNIGQVVEKTMLNASLQYLQYRFQDINMLSIQQRASLHSTLEFLEVQAELIKNNEPFVDNLLSSKLQGLIMEDENVSSTLSQIIKRLFEKDASIHNSLQEKVKELITKELKAFDYPAQVISHFAWRVSDDLDNILLAWADSGAVDELRKAFKELQSKYQSSENLPAELRERIVDIRKSLDNIPQSLLKRSSWEFNKESKERWQKYLDYWIPNSAKTPLNQISQGN